MLTYRNLIWHKHIIHIILYYNLKFNLTTFNLQIAICTSDSREGTLEFLERQDLGDLVDMVVCGDDAEGKPKPGKKKRKILKMALNF